MLTLLWKIWPLKNYSAITLPWGVYYNPDCVRSLRLIKHETQHIVQRNAEGLLKFYFKYLCFYVFNLLKYRNHTLAYMQIPYEIEAREAEKK